MISAGLIRDHLLGRLEPIFGRPKNVDSLAETLTKHVHERASGPDLEAVADRIITTRKARGFPVASELIGALRAIVPTSASAGNTGAIPGEISFHGEIPMTWVYADDPRWDELCKIAVALEPRNKQGRRSKPYPMTSKYAPGMGRFFRTEHVRSVPITDDERGRIGRLYATARATPGMPLEAE